MFSRKILHERNTALGIELITPNAIMNMLASKLQIENNRVDRKIAQKIVFIISECSNTT